MIFGEEGFADSGLPDPLTARCGTVEEGDWLLPLVYLKIFATFCLDRSFDEKGVLAGFLCVGVQGVCWASLATSCSTRLHLPCWLTGSKMGHCERMFSSKGANGHWRWIWVTCMPWTVIVSSASTDSGSLLWILRGDGQLLPTFSSLFHCSCF